MRYLGSPRLTCLLGLMTATAFVLAAQIVALPVSQATLGRARADGAVTAVAHGQPSVLRGEHVGDQVAPLAQPGLSTRRDGTCAGQEDRRDLMLRPLVTLSLPAPATGVGTSLVAERVTYGPRASVAVRRQTQVRVVSLEAGALDVRIDGAGFLDRRWPVGSHLAKEPNRVTGLIHLHPGDVLAVPADTAFVASNPRETPAVSVEVAAKLALPPTPMTDRAGTANESSDLHRERLMAAIVSPRGEPR
jgi:hypothetical protein